MQYLCEFRQVTKLSCVCGCVCVCVRVFCCRCFIITVCVVLFGALCSFCDLVFLRILVFIYLCTGTIIRLITIRPLK